MDCIICGKKIPRARLEAVPDTEFCVKCAEKYGPQVSDEVAKKPARSLDSDDDD